jgi:hypothetical protein
MSNEPASSESVKQPIQKRGGISLPTNGRRPTAPPPKPPDSASSAKPPVKED